MLGDEATQPRGSASGGQREAGGPAMARRAGSYGGGPSDSLFNPAFWGEGPVRRGAPRVAFRALCAWTDLALCGEVRRPQEVGAGEFPGSRWALGRGFGAAPGWTRREGLVDLAVAGEVGSRRQGAGSFRAGAGCGALGCRALPSRGVAARRLFSGPRKCGALWSASGWGWAGVGVGRASCLNCCVDVCGTRRVQGRLDRAP